MILHNLASADWNLRSFIAALFWPALASGQSGGHIGDSIV